MFKFLNQQLSILKNINLINKKKPKIIFYSENESYQKYAYLLIKTLSREYPNQVYYVSSDKNDKIRNLNVNNLYIGKSILLQYFFLIISAENIFFTLTDLNNHQIKKTKNVDNYIYYFHAPASTTKVYTESAFDNFDTILCNGDYQIDEIRKRESLKNLTEKKLIKTGYFYFDYLKDKINNQVKADEILIAPSWNYKQKNFLNENIEAIIENTLNKGFKVRFRPHPENLKRSKPFLNYLKYKFLNKNFIYDNQNENLEAMENAKCLITDSSGIAIEYILIFKKPVLYFDDVDKVHNPKFSQFDNLITMDFKVKNKFGYIFKKNEINNIDLLINTALSEFINKDSEIDNFITQNFYNFGGTANKFKENINKIF